MFSCIHDINEQNNLVLGEYGEEAILLHRKSVSVKPSLHILVILSTSDQLVDQPDQLKELTNPANSSVATWSLW